MVASGGESTQKALQAVAQGTRWTYSVLWQLCPHQGALVWAEGHYNGAIKTRKTVQPDGDEEEEAAPAGSAGRAARRRSRQLRELYESLASEAAAAAAGGGGGGSGSSSSAPAARRPCASLAPEDLAETEWFYLMCASYCFPPGVGYFRMPGKAFATRRHVWLTGANEVDSKLFLRAILAKSAGIQTVACIPVADGGVLEIGTTEKVEEDIALIQYARSLFMDQHGHHTVPTLSGHSTSDPTTHVDDDSPPLQITKRDKYIAYYTNVQQQQPRNLSPEDKRRSEIEDDDDDNDDDDMLDTERASDLDASGNGCRRRHHAALNFASNEQQQQDTPNAAAGSSELMMMHVKESDRARYYGRSSYMDDEKIGMQMGCQNSGGLGRRQLDGPDGRQWVDLPYGKNPCSGYLDPSSDEDQAVPPENAHYVKTVLRILRYNNVIRQAASSVKTTTYLASSSNNDSSFSRWKAKGPVRIIESMAVSECTPQRMLRAAILFNASSREILMCRKARSPAEASMISRDGEGTSRPTRRGQAQQTEMSASHVLKERRRREKLNERFVVLRSLVPFVTKMDRASILGDTIEYLKQLRRHIQDLKSSPRPWQTDGGGGGGDDDMATTQPPPATSQETRGYSITRASTGVGPMDVSGSTGITPSAAAGSTEVRVSVIESDDEALLLELRCPNRDGLLLRVMQAVHGDLRMVVTAVQASLTAAGVLLAELRVKVNDEVHGRRRSSIAEVKRAIYRVLSSD